jgi:hypothetical protein
MLTANPFDRLGLSAEYCHFFPYFEVFDPMLSMRSANASAAKVADDIAPDFDADWPADGSITKQFVFIHKNLACSAPHDCPQE